MRVAEREMPQTRTAMVVIFGLVALGMLFALVVHRYGTDARAQLQASRIIEIEAETAAFCATHARAAEAATCRSDLELVRDNHGKRLLADVNGIL
jgi:hypothetical protein